MIENLHWLRPWWLLALLPVLLLLLLAWRQQQRSRSGWRNHIDSHLLPHLLHQPGANQRRWPLLLLAFAWLLVVLALAGPVWQRIELPMYHSQQPTVVVLNLSPAMTVRDESPDRLSRARHKISDIISQLKGMQLALIIYADSPFVAAPLTDDGQVILNMLPELSGDLMPPLGERADLAIDRAAELLAGAGAATGRIILFTPGLGDEPGQTLAAAAAARGQGYALSVLGVGSDAGGSFRDRWGRSQLSRRDSDGLAELARAGGGAYAALGADDSDWQQLLAMSDDSAAGKLGNGQGRGDQWQEQGHWLLLLPLLCAPLAFRRGWLVLVLAYGVGGALLLAPSPAMAAWRDWWQTPDQQASEAFAQGQFAAAGAQFRDPAWAASARYKAGDYSQAAQAFQQLGTAQGYYNAGNALARAGDYAQALAAYDQALQAAPEHKDAAFNRELVTKLLEQQQQEQQQNGGQQQSQNQQGQSQQDQQGQPQQSAQNGQQGQPQNSEQGQPQNSEQQASSGQQQAEGQQQLQQQMDKALAEAKQQPKGEDPGKAPEAEPVASQGQVISAEQQAREQLLRQVPDDHTGLLRARIYHHYRNPRNRR